jgi:putative tryptophan/tyrosine transport system substrate-binding protein
VLLNDPVGQGFISSLARPGGNVTGFTFFEYAMFGKSLELLKKVAPAVTRIGFIFNPDILLITTSFCLLSRPMHGSIRSS